MFFDEGVLNVICNFIDDPKTFFAFSQVCRRAARVCKLYEERKMDQFVRFKNCCAAGGVCILTTTRTLPNGTKHGLQLNQFMLGYEMTKKKYFKKGQLVAKYKSDFGPANIYSDEDHSDVEKLTIYNNEMSVHVAMKLLEQKVDCPEIFSVRRI